MFSVHFFILKMFEKQKTVGEGCDFATLPEALEKAESGTHLLLKPGEYKFTENIVFKKALAIQTDDDNLIATISAPQIIFDMEPSVFVVCSRISFNGHVIMKSGTTATFEVCNFTSPYTDENAICTIISSAPTLRFCTFSDFPKHAIEYCESKGGICTDCTFVNIKCEGDPIKINPPARPFHEHNHRKD